MGPCSSKAGLFVSPSVFVSGVEYRGLVSCDIFLDIENPNPATLHSQDLAVTLTKRSDGTLLTHGTHGHSFQADGLTTTRVSFGGSGAAGKSLLLRSSTTIRISGEVIFDAPLTPKGMVKIPFHGEETIVIQ